MTNFYVENKGEIIRNIPFILFIVVFISVGVWIVSGECWIAAGITGLALMIVGIKYIRHILERIPIHKKKI